MTTTTSCAGIDWLEPSRVGLSAPVRNAGGTVSASCRLYKILVDEHSCHGGPMKWSRPHDGQPGEWHEHAGPLELCRQGLHLTDDPAQWWIPGCTVYLVEAEGVLGSCDTPGRKFVARRVRLLREATTEELACLRIFSAGLIVAPTMGVVIAHGTAAVGAYGTATVRAYGTATVEAYDSAAVKAYGSATVEAYGTATVEAYDSAAVKAYGSATVEAYGTATVEAYDSAAVKAYGSATVRAYGTATVEAYNSATVRAHDSATVKASGSATVVSLLGSPSVELVAQQGAVHVDRRTAVPRVFTAEGECRSTFQGAKP